MGEFNRHSLIREEFKSVLNNEPYPLPIHTDGIVVLSAAPERDGEGNLITEASEENRARISFGIDLMKQIAAKKAGVAPEDLNEDEFYYNAPPLFLDGETEQLPALRELALSHGVDPDYVEDINCGDRGIGNTKTNFTVFREKPELRALSHITIVTTDYHAPRVFRTALENLPKGMSFDLIPMPHRNYSYNVFRVVRGEVRRIETYIAKGDIADRPFIRQTV